MYDIKKRKFIRKMYDRQLIQFGNFKLKSGISSPFYIDMRKLVSFPDMIEDLTKIISEKIEDVSNCLVCGVPYGAIPVAVAFALKRKLPLILLRKEKKNYGSMRQIEGTWNENQNVILMEDVITSGSSIIESVSKLNEEQLCIKDVIIFVNRQQGGVEYLQKRGLNVSCIFTIEEITDMLKNKLGLVARSRIKNFIQNNYNTNCNTAVNDLKLAINAKAKDLLYISIEKKSNLIVSADVCTVNELWNLANKCHESIVALKLHSDIIDDFTLSFAKELKLFSEKKRFLLIEDRKFADIGNTQYLQITKGYYNISSWADMITMHFIQGASSLEVIREIGNIGIIGIVEMSSEGNLIDQQYSNKSLQIMQQFSDLFVGAVCQRKNIGKYFIKFTPGISIEHNKDDRGQTYSFPEVMIKHYGTDFLIVGRSIYNSSDISEEAKKYKQIGWQYCQNYIVDKLNLLSGN